MENEFDIRLEDVADSVREKVRRLTADYSVPIIVNLQFIGSGTLVQIGPHMGILTAEHVVNHPYDRNIRLVAADKDQVFLTCVADYPHALQIESKYLRIHTTARLSDSYGPDLAFIKIPNGSFLSEIKARKSFLNVTADMVNNLDRSLDDRGFMAFVGFPAVDKLKGKPQLGFTDVELLQGWTFFTGQENYEVKDGFDYCEVGVSRERGNTAPASFGGVSGGGLWRVPIHRKAGDPPGTEDVENCPFAGVIYYQSAIVDEHQFLRAHGPKSLYGKFFDEVVEAFG